MLFLKFFLHVIMFLNILLLHFLKRGIPTAETFFEYFLWDNLRFIVYLSFLFFFSQDESLNLRMNWKHLFFSFCNSIWQDRRLFDWSILERQEDVRQCKNVVQKNRTLVCLVVRTNSLQIRRDGFNAMFQKHRKKNCRRQNADKFSSMPKYRKIYVEWEKSKIWVWCSWEQYRKFIYCNHHKRRYIDDRRCQLEKKSIRKIWEDRNWSGTQFLFVIINDKLFNKSAASVLLLRGGS